MYERFGYPGLFAAYNVGPGRYAAFLADQRALPKETIRYVEAIGLPQPILVATPFSSSPATLFVVSNSSPDDAAP